MIFRRPPFLKNIDTAPPSIRRGYCRLNVWVRPIDIQQIVQFALEVFAQAQHDFMFYALDRACVDPPRNRVFRQSGITGDFGLSNSPPKLGFLLMDQLHQSVSQCCHLLQPFYSVTYITTTVNRVYTQMLTSGRLWCIIPLADCTTYLQRLRFSRTSRVG